jgi:ABC-2 type transport system ATP-binding protein
MLNTILKTTNLTKRYGQQLALDNVNIEINRGEIYGLIGLNGAGKTTFMRAICGLIQPTSGEIELFGGTGAKALAEGRRRIGQLIESPQIYPNMTAAGNLEMQRTVAGVPGKANVARILKVVGLEGTGRKKAKDFSLGMRQRLAIGMALISNPELLILDEPVNGLDPKGIMEVRELMRSLAQEHGITLIVSSHLLDELAHVATSFGIINGGKLIKQLSAQQLSEESRRYIRLLTPDPAAATAALAEKMQIKDLKATSKNEIRIYEKTDQTADINKMLINEGIEVEGIIREDQQLEDYFVDIIA